MDELPDRVEGLSGRWTFFTQLQKVGQPESKVAATIFSIDSAQELKVGIGRLFDSKKKIGERQAIVASRNLEALHSSVGEDLTIHYDVKLILNMFQALTGEILPRILTKSTTREQLEDPETRSELASELAEFLQGMTPFQMDEEGYILVDFED